MKKEKIIIQNKIVTDNYINIDCEHTVFCRMRRSIYPSINELEKQVKQLRKKLRDQGVQLYRTDTLKLLKENKKEYVSMVAEYHKIFDKLVEGWKKKINDGMYVGYIDDK